MHQAAFIARAEHERRSLPHQVPPWVNRGATYLLTICARPRHRDQLCRGAAPHATRAWLQVLDARASWQWIACVVMPDHVHVLATIPPTTNIPAEVAAWKRYMARVHRVSWQRDFFEHRLRRDEHIEVKREYLRQNPVRAGLVEAADEWPHFWAAW